MTGLHQNPPKSLLEGYGCTVEQWRELRDIGLRMVADGGSADRTPLRAFCHQRNAAVRRRGIEWQLTLMDWWTVWQESGRWTERGLGRGYMMCRKGDLGPYAVGNVFIGPGAENLSAAAKKCDLPIGVARAHKKCKSPYRAYCNIGGKQRHLGVFATVQEAHVAYLAARDLDMASRQQPERTAA